MNPDPTDRACARVRGRLDELLDMSLAPLEAARDAGHLEACVACQAEREQRAGWLADVRAALAPSPELAARADAALAAALEREQPAPRPALPGGRRLAAAVLLAAAALVLLALVPALPGGESAVRAWSEASLPELAPDAFELAWPSTPTAPWGVR